MVNRLSFRNLRIDNFKLITWLQIFIIAITPNFIFFQSANATTVAGEGWSVTKKLVQGATTFYDGTKNIVINGKNYAATGTAKITPAAAQVSKMIVRVGAVVAVDLAIKALIGSVDYVMDPANNEVVYKVPGENPAPTNCKLDYSDCPPTINNLWRNSGLQATFFFTPQAACDNIATVTKTQLTSMVQQNATNYRCYIVDTKGVSNSYVVSASINPKYDPNAPPAPDTSQTKRLGYDAVASQIMSDAMAEKPEGKAFVSTVADTALEEDEQKQIVPATDVIQQLTQSQAIPTTGTGTGTAVPAPTTGDPTTGDPATGTPPYDIKLNFPVFCDWAPVVCQAAQVAINFPGTVAGYWTTFNKWMNESASDTSETKPEVKELELNFDDGSRINFDQTCPQPQPIQVTFMGVTQDASFSFEPLCNFMIMIRPFVIGSAYLIGAYIVMGLSRGNSE
ncbi:hypothetical protein AXE41_RS19110 [Acinetobacter baumannii]|uniref:virulence factor TspB C-terminal domain-related protein n=1 Tax=Acinetobacter baumannii TaxID=470 RepID=UPI000707FE5A|nr:virulence factor TspB C-terminal domain-related protein [Acinetobacter baumannii]EHU2405803.1 hypothetical protein [Acinetobacter baumannii]EHU3103686.1 hypothetical protein [Acinetobacter baumannii]EHU3112242.1 hypothetical protein [Acinetobacter baumannii]EIB6940562.1 hypothetical protein [Acinetobacter baumannii]KQF88651.1 hypothetical protein APC24_02690 [Acinetobacter baumannii]